MFDMMLGPLGQAYWAGSSAMAQARFHHDWSRVTFGAGAQVQPLDGFSYGIGTQAPAALAAAIAAGAPAQIWDTSISKPDAPSKDCILTHFGVELQNVADVNGGDVVMTLVAFRACFHNFVIQFFYGERTNEETSGYLEDFPSGLGSWIMDVPAAFSGTNNGMPVHSNVKPLPQPLACKGGETYIRATFSPKVRGVGTTPGIIVSFMNHIYGVSPARRPPVEAHNNAMQALALPR